MSMNYGDVLIFFAFISAIVGIISALLFTIFLQKHKILANIIFWGFYFVKYLRQYRDLTLMEHEKSGPLYYSYIIFFNLAFVSALLGLLIR
jgi:hypothetical protein